MITFDINGKEYEFTISSEVSDGLDELSGKFKFETNKLHGIKNEDEVTVKVDGETFLTGFIFRINDSERDAEYSITVSGFSKSFDLLSSTLENITITGGLSLGDTITEIIKNVNSDLKVIDETGQSFTDNEKIKAEFGDNVFELISAYCRKKQSLVTSNEDGDLLLTRGQEKDSGLIIANRENGNVLQSTAFDDRSDLHSEYKVKSQLNTTLLNLDNEIDPKVITNQDGTVANSDVRNTRVLRVVAEKSSTQEMCEDRAAWLYSMKLSRSRGITYTLSGHSQNGKLYKKGELITVEDERRNISKKMLMRKVTYKQNTDDSQAGGNTTIIEVVPEGTYRVQASEPVAEKTEEIFTFE